MAVNVAAATVAVSVPMVIVKAADSKRVKANRVASVRKAANRVNNANLVKRASRARRVNVRKAKHASRVKRANHVSRGRRVSAPKAKHRVNRAANVSPAKSAILAAAKASPMVRSPPSSAVAVAVAAEAPASN
jgi:hypothetical protein